MCAAILRSEALAEAARWSDGRAELAVACCGGETRLSHLYQSDPCRVLFPRPAPDGPFEAVLVTTSGGLVGGDRLRLSLAGKPHSTASVTSQAAEKIYRSSGATTEIAIGIAADAGATLEWVPQETIVFNGARLRRATRIDAAPGSRVLAGEIVVFGRIAHGEVFGHGFLHDEWRIVRDGALVWADALHLEGDVSARIASPAGFEGATACATFLYVADDAPARLETARSIIGTSADGCLAAASCIGAVLVIRFLGRDAAAVRRSYAALWSAFRAEVLGLPKALPRVWQI